MTRRHPHLPIAPHPVLADERVALRRVLAGDADTIVEISVYDGVRATSAREARAMLARIDDDQRGGEAIHWGITVVGDDGDMSDEVVGTIGYYRGFAGGVGEVGYVLREAYRGGGLMAAALRLVVAFGRERLRLAGVRAFTAADNQASIAVLRRAGFEPVPTSGGTLEFWHRPR
jgi:[ribosomal protein S5]-alanine N-acetyltransferase